MTKFNPENKETLSYSESIGTLMEITNKEDAQQYFKKYVEYLKERLGNISYPAEDVAQKNVQYYMGYYSNEAQERIKSFDLW